MIGRWLLFTFPFQLLLSLFDTNIAARKKTKHDTIKTLKQ